MSNLLDSRDPVDWDGAYARGTTPWDRGAPAPELARLIKEGALHNLGPRVLVPGCGTGHDAMALAAAGFEVTGVDISPRALATARAADPHQTVIWTEFDLFAKTKPESLTSFDWAWEHTCLSGILPRMRPDYFQAIADSVRDGGHWLGIFFIDTEVPLEEGPPFSIAEDELKRQIAPHFAIYSQWSPQAVYPDRGGIELCLQLHKTSATS